MRKAFLILLILIAVIGSVMTACAPPAPPAIQALPTPAEAPLLPEKFQAEALEALETLKKLITEENYKQMGFESLDEVAFATLGEPIQDFMVRLDHLKKYQKGSDPNKMLSATNLLVYPVLVRGQVRSSIKGVVEEGTWKSVSFGEPNYIKMVMSQLKKQSEEQKLPSSSFFIVRVPAFNLVFLGHRAEKELMLTPIMDIPEFRFKAGVSMSADTIFATLAPAAEKHEGLPG